MTDQELNRLLCDAYIKGFTDGKNNPNTLDAAIAGEVTAISIVNDYKSKNQQIFVPPTLVPREQILIYYLKKFPGKYISMDTLDQLLSYIRRKLYIQGDVDKYTISYTVFTEDVIKMCTMYAPMFYFDDFTGYIWGSDSVLKKKDCDLDENIEKIIDSFLDENENK